MVVGFRCHPGWTARQVVLPTRVFAGRVCRRAQPCSSTAPDLAPPARRHWLSERDHHAPFGRLRPMRPGGVSDPAHAGQATRIGRDRVHVEHQRADTGHAGDRRLLCPSAYSVGDQQRPRRLSARTSNFVSMSTRSSRASARCVTDGRSTLGVRPLRSAARPSVLRRLRGRPIALMPPARVLRLRHELQVVRSLTQGDVAHVVDSHAFRNRLVHTPPHDAVSRIAPSYRGVVQPSVQAACSLARRLAVALHQARSQLVEMLRPPSLDLRENVGAHLREQLRGTVRGYRR